MSEVHILLFLKVVTRNSESGLNEIVFEIVFVFALYLITVRSLNSILISLKE